MDIKLTPIQNYFVNEILLNSTGYVISPRQEGLTTASFFAALELVNKKDKVIILISSNSSSSDCKKKLFENIFGKSLLEHYKDKIYFIPITCLENFFDKDYNSYKNMGKSILFFDMQEGESYSLLTYKQDKEYFTNIYYAYAKYFLLSSNDQLKFTWQFSFGEDVNYYYKFYFSSHYKLKQVSSLIQNKKVGKQYESKDYFIVQDEKIQDEKIEKTNKYKFIDL